MDIYYIYLKQEIFVCANMFVNLIYHMLNCFILMYNDKYFVSIEKYIKKINKYMYIYMIYNHVQDISVDLELIFWIFYCFLFLSNFIILVYIVVSSN